MGTPSDSFQYGIRPVYGRYSLKQFGYILCFCMILTLSGCENGSGGPAAIDAQETHTSLQDEVDDLPHGGTLIVRAGIYGGGLRVRDKVVHLQAQAPGAVLDGRGSTCLTINNASGSTISGFLFVNCEDGILTDSVVSIRNSSFFDNVDGVDYEGAVVSWRTFAFTGTGMMPWIWISMLR
jgi:hypothetical protein